MGNQSRGPCAYCGREMAADAGDGPERVLLHVLARDADSGDFWLSLEVNGDARMKKIDEYLRAIWLECCGHLSQFSLGGWGGRKIGMEREAAAAFSPGAEITHIYDFGTESVTLLTLVGTRQGKALSKHPITLMARNTIPEVQCQVCGEPAAVLCTECIYEDEASGLLCRQHAKRHPHRNYGPPLQLTNSPRLGMCGYEGPADPPY
jgi:hypothetical protein